MRVVSLARNVGGRGYMPEFSRQYADFGESLQVTLKCHPMIKLRGHLNYITPVQKQQSHNNSKSIYTAPISITATF